MPSTQRLSAVAVLPLALAILAPVLWGGNFVVGRAMEANLNPIALNSFRWCVAAVVVAPFALFSLIRSWSAIVANLPILFFASALGVVAFNAVLYAALTMTTASNAGLIFAATPFVILAIRCVELRSLPARAEVAAMAISMIGVAIVFFGAATGTGTTHGAAPSLSGGVLVALASLIWAAYCCVVMKLPKEIRSDAAFFAQILIGIALMTVPTLVLTGIDEVRALTTMDLVGIAYLGIFAAAIAFFAWQTALISIGARRAGIFLNLIPISGVLLSSLLLGERIKPHHMIGGALILASAVWLQARASEAATR